MNKKNRPNISYILKKVNSNSSGIFNRDSQLIAILPTRIARIICTRKIYISEFVVAKIKGKIQGFEGHPKITDELILSLPTNLKHPTQIIEDTRKHHRKEYIFIAINPLRQIIVEVERKISGRTEINSIFETTPAELKRLEGKLPTIFSSSETPSSRMHASIQK